MALKLIGAVGLKVRPEAENFRDEAERDIKRQMRGADRDGYKYPIKPEVDKEHMRRELDTSKARLRDALGDMQKQADKKKLDLRVNSDKFRRDAHKVQEIYAGMYREMENRKKAWFASDQFRLNTDEFEDDLSEIKHRFDRIAEEMDDTEVDLKPVIDESALRTAWARIKWLTRDRFAIIHVKVNQQSMRAAKNALKALYGMTGSRTGIDMIKDFGEYIRDLDKHVPALGAVGTAAVAAVGGVTALVGSVAHLANEFVRMGGAALALPGILGGFAVGIGAMVAVLKDFNREVPQISQDLGKLQDKMSDNFWKQAKIPLLDAWNEAFPHFSKGIQQTSTELGKWTAAFSKAFSTHFDMSAFDTMFGNLNKSIGIAALGVDDFVKSMSILGQTGSEYLPAMARWANEVNASFAGWLENAQATGQLNDMIDTGIQKLKEFGVIVREAGELIYILGSAAERAGFSGFGEMSRGLESFNEKLKSLEGQRVLDDIFQGASKIADGFKRALGAVGDFVWNSSDMLNELSGIVGGMVGDTFEDFFKAFERPKFNQGLIDFFQGISDAVGHISDSAPQISDLLGSVGSLAGTIAENMGDIAGTVIDALGPDVADLLADLEDPLNNAGDAIVNLVDALEDMGAWDALFDLVSWVVSGTVDDAATAIEGLAEALNMLTDVFGGGGKDSKMDWDPGKMFSGIEQIVAWSNPIIGLINTIKGWFTDKSLFLLIGEFFIGIGDAITSYVDLCVGIINAAWVVLETVWTGFWDWLTGLFDGGGGDSGDTWEGSATTTIFDQFGIESWGDTLGVKLDEARAWITEKWETFKSWLAGLFGGGEGDGSAMQVAIDFVMNAIDNASDIIIQIVNRAREWVANTWQGVLTALDNARTTIQNVKDKALDYARNKYQAALTAIDNARSTIQNVKNKALDYARSKYQAALTALDKARGIISQVKNQALNYAKSKYEAALKAIDRASSVVNAVQRKIDSLRGKTVDIVTNMVTKVKKIFSADGNYMPGVKKFADGGIEKHVAQIAPAGAMRVWAEPETGGEAYIPLANSKRARSEQILSTVADKFGMRLERYANGSNPGTAQQVSSGGDTVNITVESVPTDSAEEVSSAIWFDYKHMKRGNAFAFA